MDEIADIYLRHASTVNTDHVQNVEAIILDVIKYFYDISRSDRTLNISQPCEDTGHIDPVVGDAEADDACLRNNDDVGAEPDDGVVIRNDAVAAEPSNLLAPDIKSSDHNSSYVKLGEGLFVLNITAVI